MAEYLTLKGDQAEIDTAAVTSLIEADRWDDIATNILHALTLFVLPNQADNDALIDQICTQLCCLAGSDYDPGQLASETDLSNPHLAIIHELNRNKERPFQPAIAMNASKERKPVV